MSYGKVFVPTKYQGYYWNVERQSLFSTKGKELRELKRHNYFSPRRGKHVTGYSVYIRAGLGKKRGHSEFVEVGELMFLNNEPTISLAKEIILLPEELFVI